MPESAPPPLWSFAPFALLLLLIAVLPLIHRTAHWWEHNRNKLLVALLLGAATLAYYALTAPGHDGGSNVLHVLDHALLDEYVPFIVLLLALYTIAGGIHLAGDIRATPAVNTLFLGAGAVFASFIGTTGASMLLIRPILRTNSERKHKVHTVVFFIFLVSNIGGSLTPLGDPPLFLGYLRGVPFWWTLELLWPWAFTTGALLAIYYVWDRIAWRREDPKALALDATRIQPLRLEGAINFLWLFLVIACVAMVDSSRPIRFTSWKPPPHAREALLLLLIAISWWLTPGNRLTRAKNRFAFGPMAEVACLFLGIFICMQPPVEYLRIRGAELGLDSAPEFFWATGTLSSFLDNAPTYVVFLESASALTSKLAGAGALATPAIPLTEGAVDPGLLLAVSMGAVFMGANTYIGNGPNFMVKTVAESAGVRMPSFFGYMAYSMAILVPLFAAVTWLFLD